MQTKWINLTNAFPDIGKVVLLTVVEETNARSVIAGSFYGVEEGWMALTCQGEMALDDLGSFEVVGWAPLPDPMQAS